MTPAIARFLDGVRRAALRRALAGAALRLLVGAGAATLAAGALAAATAPAARIGLCAAAACAAAAIWAALALGRGLWSVRGPEAAARLAGEALPGARSDLISSVQLSHELATAPAGRIDFSPALARALAERTAGGIAAVDPAGLAPRAGVRRLLPAALVIVAGWALAGRHLLGPLHESVRILLGLSEPPSLRSELPLLADLHLRYRYPAYLGRTLKDVVGASGDLVVPAGTEVEIDGRPVYDLRDLRIVHPGGEAAAEPDGDRVRARFLVAGTGHWHVEGRRPDRARLRGPDWRIDIEPDDPPRLELGAPEDGYQVASDALLALGFLAEDDHGVTAVDLVWRVDGGPEQRQPVPAEVALGAAAPRQTAGTLDWDLAPLGLRPGASVRYAIEALDNDEVGGPKAGRSEERELRVFDPRERHDSSIGEQQQALDRVLGNLADRLELPAGAGAGPWNAVHDGAAAVLEALAVAREKAREDPLAPADLGETLAGMHDRIERRYHGEGDLLRASPDARDPALAEHGARVVEELERDAIELRDLIDRQRLDAMRGIGEEMRAMRGRLRELIERYRRERDPDVLREIERELAAMEARMRDLMRRASELEGEVSEEYLHADALRRHSFLSELRELRDLLGGDRADEALARLEEIGRRLDEMMSALDQGMSGLRRARRGDPGEPDPAGDGEGECPGGDCGGRDRRRAVRGDWTGDGLSSERVAIPGEDASRAPAEWREAILDAMKERPPKAYEPQVKRYYRELVR